MIKHYLDLYIHSQRALFLIGCICLLSVMSGASIAAGFAFLSVYFSEMLSSGDRLPYLFEIIDRLNIASFDFLLLFGCILLAMGEIFLFLGLRLGVKLAGDAILALKKRFFIESIKEKSSDFSAKDSVGSSLNILSEQANIFFISQVNFFKIIVNAGPVFGVSLFMMLLNVQFAAFLVVGGLLILMLQHLIYGLYGSHNAQLQKMRTILTAELAEVISGRDFVSRNELRYAPVARSCLSLDCENKKMQIVENLFYFSPFFTRIAGIFLLFLFLFIGVEYFSIAISDVIIFIGAAKKAQASINQINNGIIELLKGFTSLKYLLGRKIEAF